jgi:hypothetical protein
VKSKRLAASADRPETNVKKIAASKANLVM